MKEILSDFIDWLWLNHNILTNADKNKLSLEQYLNSEQGKKALSLFQDVQLAAYKEGFANALDSLKAANDVVQLTQIENK